MQKEQYANIVHLVGLGRRQRTMHNKAQPLPEGVIKPPNVIYSRCPMQFLEQQYCISLPKVGGQKALLYHLGTRSRDRRTVTNSKGRDLIGAPAMGKLQPAFVNSKENCLNVQS